MTDPAQPKSTGSQALGVAAVRYCRLLRPTVGFLQPVALTKIRRR